MYTSDPASFPEPVDLSHHLSRSTRAREASTIKKFYKYFRPGIGQIAGGTMPRRDDMGIFTDSVAHRHT